MRQYKVFINYKQFTHEYFLLSICCDSALFNVFYDLVQRVHENAFIKKKIQNTKLLMAF